MHKLLDDFETDLLKIRAIWRQIEIDNPSFDQVSEKNWQEKCARMWLHGATKVAECNELERWLFDHPPLTATAQIQARKVYRSWRKWLETKGPCEEDFGPRGAYYVEFDEFQIPNPQKDELLIHFVIRLAQSVENDGKGHRLEWRALKSFLNFIRKTYPVEEVAFIEHIFPKKMDVRPGLIIRKIALEVPSIPEETAAKILVELAKNCQFGRRNAQLTAAESLGLCWLCLTASRLRLPIYLETLRTIKPTAVQIEGEFPILLVPTFFGDRPIRISWRAAKFLHALSLIPSKKPRETILQSPFRSLTRTFEGALKTISLNPEFGSITYVSLLSPPHHFGTYRYQPK